MFNLNDVADLIVKVARREDEKLKDVGRGIFMMQELAFAYLVGLELARMAKQAYATDNFRWQTEKKIPNTGGISDLVFEPESGDKNGLIIEFKTRGSEIGWERDVKKLQKLHKALKTHGQNGQIEYKTLFCALVDSYTKACKNNGFEDERIAHINKISGVTSLIPPSITNKFITQNFGYRGELCCVVCVWQVEP